MANRIDMNKVYEEGINFLTLDAARKADPTEKLSTFMGYAIKNLPNQEAAASAHDILRNDPAALGQQIREGLVRHRDGLVAEVEKAPQKVVKEIPQQHVIGMSVPYFGDENYKALREQIEKGENTARTFAETYSGSNLWKQIVMTASDTVVNNAATKHVQRETQKEILKNLCTQQGTYSPTKAAEFLVQQSRNKTEKNDFYLEVGTTYTQTKAKSAS